MSAYSIWSNNLCICKASIALIFSHAKPQLQRARLKPSDAECCFLSLSLSDSFPNFPLSSHSEPPMRVLSSFLTRSLSAALIKVQVRMQFLWSLDQ